MATRYKKVIIDSVGEEFDLDSSDRRSPASDQRGATVQSYEVVSVALYSVNDRWLLGSP
jgi:hypothetical protein